MASGQPKLQPQLQLPPHLLIEQSRVFGNSTPLVLHSLFKHITPTFAKEPELTPSPATGLQSALSLDQQPKLTPQNGFFSDPNADVGKAAEGLGDLLSGLAAGDLSSKVSIEAGGNPSFGKERQVNPATLFATTRNLKLTPFKQHPDSRITEKNKQEEELQFKRRRHSKP